MLRSPENAVDATGRPEELGLKPPSQLSSAQLALGFFLATQSNDFAITR